MIQAIIALVVTAVVAYSLWEIVSGLLEIATGIFLCVTGAALYILACLVEFAVRVIRLFRRRA